VAGLVLLPWFWLASALVPLDPGTPSFEAGDSEVVAFYVENVRTLPLSATLFVGQWVIVQILLVSVIMATRVGSDLVAVLATTLTTAATAVYVAAEGVLVWPILATGMDADALAEHLGSAAARGAVLSRDGLHAPGSVLLGVAALLIAWLLVTGPLWGRWVMGVLAAGAGLLALTSIALGPEGFGPGLIFVIWGPVTAVCLLLGLRRESRSPRAPRPDEPLVTGGASG
jgi:hypothetical protein